MPAYFATGVLAQALFNFRPYHLSRNLTPYLPNMASSPSSSRRRHTTHFDEEGEVIVRSKRSSVTIECSDGHKVVFTRPSRPRSGLSWSSRSGMSSLPPPPPPPGPAPGPRPSPQGGEAPQPEHENPNQPASVNTSRSSTSGHSKGETPRSGYGGNEESSHNSSQHASSSQPSMRHMEITERPKRIIGTNIDKRERYSMEAVVGISPVPATLEHRGGQSREQIRRRRPRQGGAAPDATAFLYVDANIRGGLGRPRRRSRSIDGSDISGSSIEDSGDRYQHRIEGVLRSLRRYFPFSCWLFGKSRDDRAHDRSRSRSRSRRTRRH
ncbi:hypothetical protein GGR58DRAFT_138995 [Xylaria digitata]|nr:hypothetical protein GGR58DRAFT_138995 [Xylaria digitata]